jgi:hypothetical protein
MDQLIAALFDVEERIRDIMLNLRDQQELANAIDRYDALFACLLSTSLRTFAWIEDQRHAVVEAIGEHFPLSNSN